MQSSIWTGAVEGLSLHEQPSHDFLEAHDMFWWELEDAGVGVFFIGLCKGLGFFLYWHHRSFRMARFPLGDPATWGPAFDFGFQSSWANGLGSDLVPAVRGPFRIVTFRCFSPLMTQLSSLF
jgi:hypothetical protein